MNLAALQPCPLQSQGRLLSCSSIARCLPALAQCAQQKPHLLAPHVCKKRVENKGKSPHLLYICKIITQPLLTGKGGMNKENFFPLPLDPASASFTGFSRLPPGQHISETSTARCRSSAHNNLIQYSSSLSSSAISFARDLMLK